MGVMGLLLHQAWKAARAISSRPRQLTLTSDQRIALGFRQRASGYKAGYLSIVATILSSIGLAARLRLKHCKRDFPAMSLWSSVTFWIVPAKS